MLQLAKKCMVIVCGPDYQDSDQQKWVIKERNSRIDFKFFLAKWHIFGGRKVVLFVGKWRVKMTLA